MSFWFFMYEPIVDTTGRVGEVVLQSCDTNSKRYYFHKEIKMKNRTQSGKVGRVDKNNQPTRPAGDRNTFFSTFFIVQIFCQLELKLFMMTICINAAELLIFF